MSLFRLSCVLTALCMVCNLPVPVLADPTPAYETTFHGHHLASGHGVVVDPQGNAYVIAADYEDTVHLDILVMKLDPGGEILWSEYIYGNGHDYATDIVLDGTGDILITGFTDSDDFPLVDPLDDTLTGFRDAFVTRMSSEDGTILYSTYIGGDYVDEGWGIALDATGEIVLAGSTESSDFPTVQPLQAELKSPSFADAFVMKLAADGSAIVYSTYLGGSRDDRARGLALDGSGAIHLAGETDSTDFPTAQPLQPAYAGGDGDLFITRISADGATLETSTYLGGEDWERLGGIVLDASGALYVAGSTRSVSYPTTPGAYQEEFVGEILGCEIPFVTRYNCEDGFVSKLAPGAGSLAWSTYLGGTRVDELRDVAVDGTGSVRVAGYTNSADFPPAGIGSSAAIVLSRLDAAGSGLVYTFVKDSGSANAGQGVTVDGVDGTYLTGAIEVPAAVYVAKLGPDPQQPALLHRGVVPGLDPGWKQSALPLNADNDEELAPFPLETPVPGSAEDALPATEPLVLYRLLLPGGVAAGNSLRAAKQPTGTELRF